MTRKIADHLIDGRIRSFERPFLDRSKAHERFYARIGCELQNQMQFHVEGREDGEVETILGMISASQLPICTQCRDAATLASSGYKANATPNRTFIRRRCPITTEAQMVLLSDPRYLGAALGCQGAYLFFVLLAVSATFSCSISPIALGGIRVVGLVCAS